MLQQFSFFCYHDYQHNFFIAQFISNFLVNMQNHARVESCLCHGSAQIRLHFFESRKWTFTDCICCRYDQLFGVAGLLPVTTDLGKDTSLKYAVVSPWSNHQWLKSNQVSYNIHVFDTSYYWNSPHWVMAVVKTSKWFFSFQASLVHQFLHTIKIW